MKVLILITSMFGSIMINYFKSQHFILFYMLFYIFMHLNIEKLSQTISTNYR